MTSTKKIKKHVLKVPSSVADEDARYENGSDTANGAAAVTAPNCKAAANGDGSHLAEVKCHATTMRDLVRIVLKELITERHSMLVEPDGSM